MPFFVTIIRDSQVGVLSGPFGAKTEAESFVEPTRLEALKVDPMSHFDSFGVSLIPGRGSAGSLNTRLGLPGNISYGVWLEGKSEHYHGATS